MIIKRLLKLAAKAARADKKNKRTYSIGAIAIRVDGTLVDARNGSNQQKAPSAHAEARVLRKAGRHAILFVARVKHNGEIGLAMPCINCIILMKLRKVDRCYYTISANKFGFIDIKNLSL